MEPASTAAQSPANSAPNITAVAASVDTHGPRRRRTPWQPTSWYGKGFLWLTSLALDPHDNYPSGPRCLVWTIVIGAICRHEINAALAAIVVPTMWGYSMVKDQQSRTTLSLAAQMNSALSYGRTFSKKVTESIQRVFAGRDVEKGIDPSQPEPDPSGGAE